MPSGSDPASEFDSYLARADSPPHHAEGVSSTRRGEGSGVGVWSAATMVSITPVIFSLVSESRTPGSWRRTLPPPLAAPRKGEGNIVEQASRFSLFLCA